MWRTFRAHPAVIPLILTRRTSSRASLAPAEALAAALARGGLDGVDLFVAFRAVSAFVTGIAQNELAGALSREKDPASAARRIEALAQGALPTLAELAPVGAVFTGQEFERGLTLILNGITHTPRPFSPHDQATQRRCQLELNGDASSVIVGSCVLELSVRSRSPPSGSAPCRCR